MSDRPFAIITTRLPPAMCGVGAHSALLRKSWPGSSPVEFLVMDGASESSLFCDGDRVTQFDGESGKLAGALDRLGAADVVLHYAGRAYQRFGCPIWLPGVLAKWKRKFRTGRLLVFVHEAPGDLPFASRHFWLGKVNVWILRQLASTADVLVTNTEHHREKLARLSGRSDVHLVPVGSNIEEREGQRSPRARREFVLFGLPFGRAQTLRMFEHRLRRWQAQGLLTTLHIIGPDGDGFTGPAVRHGVLPGAEVARLLQRAQFALTNVTSETWSKSTAFMACALHGCAPVISGSRPPAVPLSYAIASDEVETIVEVELQRRAAGLRRWYEENAAWPIVAARLAALLEGAKR